MASDHFTLCVHLITVILSSYLSDCQQQQPGIYFSVVENRQADTVIGDISLSEYVTSNFDPSEIAGLRYAIQEQNNPGRDISFFDVDENTGILTMAKTIDREEQDACHNMEYCSLQLTVKINGENDLKTPTIEIEILDINDNPPEFDQDSLSFQITEGSPSGTSRDLPEATDKDSPQNNVDLDGYKLQADVVGLFEIQRDEEGLKLVLKQSLDREATSSYDLKLVASDKGQPDNLSGFLQIHIDVNDANDERPVFTETVYKKEVREDLAVNLTIIQVEATDADLGLNAQVEYKFDQLTRLSQGLRFGIKPESGVIYLKQALDYETLKTYELGVDAVDKAADPKTSTTTVTIIVTDVNDETPRVQVETLTKRKNAEVQENLAGDALVALIIVSDADAGDNGRVTCSMEHQSFELKALEVEKQFKVVTKEQLDREAQSSYSLQITCRDFGNPNLEGTGMINVTVLDDNDHDPEFGQSEYQVTVPENGGIGAFIIQVSATDKDLGENGTVTYSISDPAVEKYVEIDRDTGILKTAKRLDYEELKRFTVLVKASDNGKKPRSSVASVQIAVSDENDHRPEFEADEYFFNIQENSSPPFPLGRVVAHDSDSAGNNAFVYSIGQSRDASSFSIDSISGNITTAEAFDREVKDKYSFLVYATDQKDSFLSTSVSVTANVKDENDNDPRIIYPVGNTNLTIEISNKVPVGYRIVQTSAQDADLGRNSNLSYFLYNEAGTSTKTPRFVIDRYNGEITTNKDLSSDDYKVSALRIVVNDGGASPKSASTIVTIIIDSSVKYGVTAASETPVPKDGTNTLIIVILTIVTIIIVGVLITAIFCLRRRNLSKSPADDGNGKDNDFKAPNPSKSGKASHITAVPKNSDNVEKNESFTISNASGNIPIVSALPNTEATSNISIPAHSPGGGNGHSLDTTGSDDTLPSNADSGKGPSEGDAEIGVMRVDSDRQRPINRRAPPELDLTNLQSDLYYRNQDHQYHDHHRQPQSAGPYPRHHRHQYQFPHQEFQPSPTRLIPDQDFMSRSYPNSPNRPESEYVAPSFFRLSGTDFDQSNPLPQHHQQQHEMANMQQQVLHHQHNPHLQHHNQQEFFGGNNIPMGSGTGMDSGYHSQNGPLSQSAPVETVFHGHHPNSNGQFNSSMQADSGYSSHSGGGGYNQHSPQVWGSKGTPAFSSPTSTANTNYPHYLARQYSEPAHSQYYRMDGSNQSCVDV